MHRPDPTAPFFIGYINKLPAGLKGFLGIVIASLFAGFAGIALALTLTQDDPGPGGFRFDLGYQTLTGVIEQGPYPVLRLPPSAGYPDGHAIMLSGQGKNGVRQQAAQFAGQVVDAGGILLKRGDLDMLQVGGEVGIRTSETGLAPQDADFRPSDPVDLGVWRLTGEICDGKCYAGAMRPGRGLAHRACANVCLIGGIPPVFVSTAPVAGRNFLLLGDLAGNPLPASLMRNVAQLIRIDGAVERRGDLLVFKIDPATLERLQ